MGKKTEEKTWAEMAPIEQTWFVIEVLASLKNKNIAQKIDYYAAQIESLLVSKHFNSTIAQRFTIKKNEKDEPYLEKNKKGEPYTKDNDEPAQSARIKDLLNACYYASETFKAIEQFNLDELRQYKDNYLGGVQNFDKFWSQYSQIYAAIEPAYTACRLITQLDFDPNDLFGEEASLLYDLFNQLVQYTTSHKEEATEKVKQISTNIINGYGLIKMSHNPSPTEQEQFETSRYILTPKGFFYYNKSEQLLEPIKTNNTQHSELTKYFDKEKHIDCLLDSQLEEIQRISGHKLIKTLVYDIGRGVGIAFHNLKVKGKPINYDFLIGKLISELPSAIDSLTQKIKKYTSGFIEQESELNKKQLYELQNAALDVLNRFKNLHSQDFFLSFKLLNYIHILNNLYTVSIETWGKLGNLNGSTEDFLIKYLKEIKYSILPELFQFIDKFEVNTFLEPGTLSKPLMKSIKAYYKTLIDYAPNFIDLKKKAPELLSVNDTYFLALRLKPAQDRINTAKKSIIKLKFVQDAVDKFYSILNGCPLEYYNPFDELPKDTKKELISLYHIIKPHMKRMDVTFNINIIEDLNKEKVEKGLLEKWGISKSKSNTNQMVIAAIENLQKLLSKEFNTCKTTITLNTNLIETIIKQTEKTEVNFKPIFDAISACRIILNKNNEKDKAQYLFQLPEKVKQELRDQYQILEPHIKQMNPTIHTLYVTSLNQKVEEGIFQDIKNKIIKPKDDIKGVFNLLDALEELLKQDIETYKSEDAPDDTYTIEQSDLPLVPHIKEYHVTRIDESSALKLSSEEAEKLCINSNNETFIADYDKLNSDQCLDLQQYYTHKLDTLDTIKIDAEAFFKHLLPENIAENKEEEVLMGCVDKKDKTELSRLYNHIQPYVNEFINDKLSTDFDISMVKSLAKNSTDKINIKISDLKQIEQEFNQHVNDFEKKCKFRRDCSKELFDKAQKSEIEALKSKELKQDSTPRDLFVVKHTNYATQIGQFKQTLFQFRNILNEVTKKDLTPKEYRLVEYIKDTEIKPDELNITFDEKANDTFHYIVQDPKGYEQKGTIQVTKEFPHVEFELPLTMEQLKNKKSYIIGHTASKKHTRPVGVSFPEMEEFYESLARNKKTKAIKHICNSIDHLEGIFYEFEQLDHNNKNTDWTKRWLIGDSPPKVAYVVHITFIYKHIEAIAKATSELRQDPYFKLIGQELYNQAQTLLHHLQNKSEIYRTFPKQLEKQQIIKNKPLWFITNALYNLPKDLKVSTGIDYITSEERQLFQKRATDAAKEIEYVLDNSDSYFKLLLESPKIYFLFNELKQKLFESSGITHHLVMEHLKAIHPKLLTPMLLEADGFERNLSLKPGTVSEPFQRILHELLRGFLSPLKLDSKIHLELICNESASQEEKSSLQKRIEVLKQEQEDTNKCLKKLEKNYEGIKCLYDLLAEYQKWQAKSRLHIDIRPIDLDERLNNAKDKLIKHFPTTAHDLFKIKKDLPLPEEDSKTIDTELDDALNQSLKDFDRDKFNFSNLSQLIRASYHNYLGLKSTHEINVETCQEHIKYLVKLQDIQKEQDLRTINEYTEQSFTHNVDRYCTEKDFGLIGDIEQEYQDKLRQYLTEFKKEITDEAKEVDEHQKIPSKDINQTICDALKKKIEEFEKKDHNLANYHHLSNIMMALSGFSAYLYKAQGAKKSHLSESALFENEITRGLKKKAIRAQIEIAINKHETLSAVQRIKLIKAQVVDSSTFKNTLFKFNDNIDKMEWLPYLVYHFYRLLEAVHLYTPERTTLCNKIIAEVQEEPSNDTKALLIQQFGIFSKSKKTMAQVKKEDNKQEEIVDLNGSYLESVI
jgi:hypothetical protein